MTDGERHKLTALCARVFSPSAPVNKLTLFAGRMDQVRKVSEAVNTRGRHAIMYGDRGVGKTSLANILHEVFIDVEGIRIVKVNCAETDDFRNVWRKALKEITVIEEIPPTADDPKATTLEGTLADYIEEDQHFGPGEVRRLAEQSSSSEFEIVIVFDEFDRLAPDDRGLFADLIKDLSDNSVYTTILLVGVARDVVDLIAGHASIDRCLRQILMPAMDRKELGEIIIKAMNALGMTIDQAASELIISLSQGLPHYTHLLGQEAAYRAISANRRNIALEDVEAGIQEALQNTQQTVRNDYLKAAQGQRKGTLFPQVLLACALADVDELGYFSSVDVRGPLCKITKKEYDIPNFSQHLDKFSSDESRGPVLERWGASRRFRFRFINPLLRPFIIMKGLRDNMISGELIGRLLSQGKVQRSEGRDEEGSLFH
jgi:Cdc6-like AAA superfamily ATPase